MLTIIWGHIMYSGISNAIVYAFHIPLFFFLSGLVFSRQRYLSFKDFLMRRIKGLLVPYVVFSFLTWVVWASFSYISHAPVDSYWRPLLQTIIAQGSDGYLIHNVPLWFVSCLFLVEIAYYFLSKLKDWIVIAVCVLCAIIGYLLVNRVDDFDFTALPWSIEVALMAIPFYALGNMALKHIGHSKMMESVKTHWVWTILIIIAASIELYLGARYNGSASMGHAFLGKNPFVFYVTAICGIVAFLSICILISFIPVKSVIGKLIAYIKWFGINSFRVMAVHNPIKGVIVLVVAKLFHVSSGAINVHAGYASVAFVLTVVVTTIVVWFIGWFLQKTLKRNSLMK